MTAYDSRSFENGSTRASANLKSVFSFVLAVSILLPLSVGAQTNESLAVSHPRPDDSWYQNPEKARWSFQNLSQIIPVARVSRGDGKPLTLPYADRQILRDLYQTPTGEQATLRSILETLDVDGFVALKGGVVVGEAYFNSMRPDTHHLVFSITKSFVGILVGTLVDDNIIDPKTLVTDYLPELKETGFAGATVQDLLDMVAATEWDKVRSNPNSLVNVNAMAGGFISHPEEFEFATTLEFLQSLGPKGKHGREHVYNASHTEALAWIVSRVSGKPWHEVLSERVWTQLGAEEDALIALDDRGNGFATAGINLTARDLARFGLMLQQGGELGGVQVVSSDWVEASWQGDRKVRAAWARSTEKKRKPFTQFYKNQFRVLNGATGEFYASGHQGQKLYVDVARELVVVMFSTQRDRDLLNFHIPLIRQISDRLEEDISSQADPVFVQGDDVSRYMQGVPTAEDGIIQGDVTWLRDPEKALWTHQNVPMVRTVDVISRGQGPTTTIPYADRSITSELFADLSGDSRPLIDILEDLNINGAIILKDGQIVSEAYLNGFGPEKRHLMNSATKSFLGMLVGVLADEGVLDLDQAFVDVFPELRDSGAADGTLNDALDMLLGMDWPMSWDPKDYRLLTFMAGGFVDQPEDFPFNNTLELIADAKKEMPHGQIYAYESVNTEMLGWSISRATGRPWQRVLSDRIWSKLGAERDAFVIVDKGGHGFSTAGMSASLRDLARFGLMLQDNGFYNGRQIVPASWVKDTIRGGQALRDAMTAEREISAYGPEVFYNNQFRVLNSDQGEFIATGGIGQKIYINQKHKLVAVFFAASFERAETVFQVSLMRQVRDYLSDRSAAAG